MCVIDSFSYVLKKGTLLEFTDRNSKRQNLIMTRSTRSNVYGINLNDLVDITD